MVPASQGQVRQQFAAAEVHLLGPRGASHRGERQQVGVHQGLPEDQDSWEKPREKDGKI